MKYNPEDGFPYYFQLIKGQRLSELYSSARTIALLENTNEKEALYRYAPDKWSIKQILGHITDHERIKIFRAFQLSRKEVIELWGYDQNELVRNSRFDELPFTLLLEDYANVHSASKSFVDTLSDSQLQLKGQARQYEITLEDFLKSIIGHEIHHVNILKERYLTP